MLLSHPKSSKNSVSRSVVNLVGFLVISEILYYFMSVLLTRLFKQSAPLPKRKVSTRSGSYVVDLLDPNGKKLPRRKVKFLEFELKYIRILLIYINFF